MHERRPSPDRGDQHPSIPDRVSCGRCGSHDVAFRWQVFANSTRHIRVTCRRCGRFVKYAPQTASNIERANAESGDGPEEARS